MPRLYSPLLLSPLLAAVAHADDVAQLDKVVVTAVADGMSYQSRQAAVAGRPQAVLDTPQAVQSVGPQVLSDLQARSLGDAVRNISGVVESNTLAGIQDSFTRRGFGSRGDGGVLRDGVRSAWLNNFDATTESVEALKGPASLLYGIQEPGGVINVLSKKPQYSPQGSVELRGSRFGGGGGGFDLTGPLGDKGLAYRLIGDFDESDYWRGFGLSRRRMIAPSLAWERGADQLLLAYQYLAFKTPYDRGTLFVNGQPLSLPRERRLDEAWNNAEGEAQALTLSHARQLSDAWRLATRLAWNQLRYTDRQARPVAFNAKTGMLSRRADGNRFDNSDWLLSSRLQGSLSLFGQLHQLTLGLEMERQRETRGDTYRGGNVGGFNVYAPVYGALPYPSQLSAAQSDSRSVIDSQALLLQDNWTLAPRWIASLGARYQHYRQEDGIGRPFVVTGRGSGLTLLPQAGLLFKLTPLVSLYGSYSQSFRPNVGSDGQSFSPERGESGEAGIKLERDGLSASAAAYRMEKSHVLVTENAVSRAIGKARSQGLEFDASGRLSRKVSIIANYAYTDAKVVEDAPANIGKTLYNVPRRSGSLSLAYDAGVDSMDGRWRMGGGARYVGERAGDAANSFLLPAYTVADAFVAWRRKLGEQRLELQLNVKNLFDKTYYRSSSGSALQVRVGDPREVSARARLSF
ncbi:TonB-dependent siderophore receptor [Chromobacterium paludis]|uniref:TonB-dependent siderophore receptor n=1 Tax=Chromobacterium paludis TaxID=2605945 RepID=A0A5C1DM48_9NEIS|nr:TonB-dependent siderophore receptor [Chromobacterium paludis]